MKKPRIDPDNFQGPFNVTNRQLAVLIDEHVGGWPAKASWLMRFDHKLSEWDTSGEKARLLSPAEYEKVKANRQTTFQFTDQNGISLDGKRMLRTEGWRVSLGRDEYFLMRMAPTFIQGLIQQGRDEERRRISKLLG